MEQAGIARKARRDCGRSRRQRLDRNIAPELEIGPHPIGLSVGGGIVEQRADRGAGIGAVGAFAVTGFQPMRKSWISRACNASISVSSSACAGAGAAPTSARARTKRPHQLLSAAAVSCASASASAS